MCRGEGGEATRDVLEACSWYARGMDRSTLHEIIPLPPPPPSPTASLATSLAPIFYHENTALALAKPTLVNGWDD